MGHPEIEGYLAGANTPPEFILGALKLSERPLRLQSRFPLKGESLIFSISTVLYYLKCVLTGPPAFFTLFPFHCIPKP